MKNKRLQFGELKQLREDREVLHKIKVALEKKGLWRELYREIFDEVYKGETK